MNQPKIYGFCPAGCKWETVHKSDFDAAKAAVPIREIESDHTYHLINNELNLSEENPYFDATQHFKIYDGTTSVEWYDPSNVYNSRDWSIELRVDIYVNGELATRETYSDFGEREKWKHEIDFAIYSVALQWLGGNSTQSRVTVATSCGIVTKSFDEGDSVTCDIYVVNLGYPHDEDGATTERVDGCENTRVYSIGYGNEVNPKTYCTQEQVDEKIEEVTTVKKYTVTMQGYHYNNDTGVSEENGEANVTFVIDPYGNFVFDLGSLDNFATNKTLTGFHVTNGDYLVPLKKYFSEWRDFGAIISYCENGLWNTPFSCGCKIRPNGTIENGLDIVISVEGMSVPIGVYATIQGKFYER